MALIPNTLYIALYLRSDPPTPNDFHWALYHARSNNRGTKYHITNEGPDGRWIAGHTTESPSGILKGFLLVGLIRVASVKTTSPSTSGGGGGEADVNEKIDTTLRSQDTKLNDQPGITCRIWLKQMLARLVIDGVLARSDVRCGCNTEALEVVVKNWGNRFSAEAARNVQPRPVEEGDIITPQSATLTNIEVLSFLSSNPPRRPPAAPPGVNQKHWIPSPDLRDHNTVVKEIHNYASRLAPHLLRYPGCNVSEDGSPEVETGGKAGAEGEEGKLDHALRELIKRLQPYGLTKGEVLMIVNLGVGVLASPVQNEDENGFAEGQEGAEQMDVDDQGQAENGEEIIEEGVDGDAEGQAEGEGEGEEEAGDYGALALIDTVIEEREQRLSDDNVLEILAIIRETLGAAAT
ncbi:hypothetical protein BDV06DRAFT_220218 [Aspergillus oleicola]